MEDKKISLLMLVVVVVVISLLLPVEASFTFSRDYIKTVCHDDSMLTHCQYSQYFNYLYNFYFKNSTSNNKTYQINRIINIFLSHSLILTCPIVGFTNRTLHELKTFMSRCRKVNVTFSERVYYYVNYYIAVKASPDWPILNETIAYIQDFSSHLQSMDEEYDVVFVGFKGFDIESTIVFYDKVTKVQLRDVRFDLYARDGRIVTSCDHFLTFNTSHRGFILQRNDSSMIESLKVHRPVSKHPVCSLFFRQARIYTISFHSMINSFYLKSVLTFTDPPPSNHSQNNNSFVEYRSIINWVYISNVYGFDLDSRFLNGRIFASMIRLNVYGHLNSIADDVFRSFQRLKVVELDASAVLRVIRKKGIEWIKQINKHVNVNLSNITRRPYYSKHWFLILLVYDRNLWSEKKIIKLFLDEDFCLLHDFPFHQLIIMTIKYHSYTKYGRFLEYSCTDLWLYQFHNIIEFLEELNDILKNRNLSACDFSKRIDLCQKSRFQVNSNDLTHNKLTPFDIVAIFELTFIILAPIISAFGIVTNLMTILVIFHKKNKETMREKHYLYLSAYCISNTIIFVTQITTLMSECQFPFGFYCSSIRKIVFIQYIKIIFGEYLNSACRLFSNFTYFGFSVCRLTKIGKDHGKLIVAISNLKIKTFIIISLVISAGMAVCKALQNEILIFNANKDTEVYPKPIFQFRNDWMNVKKFIVLFIFNFIFNVFNYFLFVCAHLFVDVVLIKKLVFVLREKEEKMREMKKSEKEMEDASKQNEESKRRAIFMVVLNSTVNFFTRAPLMITFINDLRYLIQNKFNLVQDEIKINIIDGFNPSFTFKFYCSNVKACLVFQSFGNCLFLFSLSTILFFLKHFDKNFKKAFQDCFVPNQKNKINTRLKKN